MKKRKSSVFVLVALILTLALGATASAAWIGFNTTTPTFGDKVVSEGNKSSGSITYAQYQTFDCEEAFAMYMQAKLNGTWTNVTDATLVYANDSGLKYYTSTPAAGTDMRTYIGDVIGLLGGQAVRGQVDYK